MASSLLTIFRSIGSLGEAATAAGGKVGKFTEGINRMGALAQSAPQIGGALEGLAKTLIFLSNPVTAASAAFSFTAKVAGDLGATMVKAFSPLEPLNAAFAAFSEVANAAVGTVTALGNTVGQFVQFANPALVKDFESAVRDVMGSIGRGLLPIMTFATATVRAFSDVIFRLSGPFQQLMRAVFDPLQKMIPKILQDFTPLLNSINGLFRALAPIGPIIAELVGAFGNSVTTFVEAFRPLLDIFTRFVPVLIQVFKLMADGIKVISDGVNRFVRSVLGIKPSTDSVRGEGFGAGTNNVKFGSVEEFFKDAMKASFMLGTGSTTDDSTPEVRAIGSVEREIIEFREWAKATWGRTIGGAHREVMDAFKNELSAITGVPVASTEEIEASKTAVDAARHYQRSILADLGVRMAGTWPDRS